MYIQIYRGGLDRKVIYEKDWDGNTLINIENQHKHT